MNHSRLVVQTQPDLGRDLQEPGVSPCPLENQRPVWSRFHPTSRFRRE